MISSNVQLWAGLGSTLIFICSNLPMLLKAFGTRDMHSYSLGQIGMANAGNLLHWLYVAGLPVGPLWLLHGFNTAVSLVMLAFYFHFQAWPERKKEPSLLIS